jgi:hypothetical protein
MFFEPLVIPALVIDAILLVSSILFTYYWAAYQIYLYGDANTLPDKKAKVSRPKFVPPFIPEYIQPTTDNPKPPAEVTTPDQPKFNLMDDDEFVIEL